MTQKSIFLPCLAQFFLLISAEAAEKNLAPISVPNKYEIENGFVGMQRDVVRLLERKVLEDSFNNPIQKLRAMNGVDAILSKQLQHVHKTDQIYISSFRTTILMLLEKGMTKWSNITSEFFHDPEEIMRLAYGNGIYVVLFNYWKDGDQEGRRNRLYVSQDGGKHWRLAKGGSYDAEYEKSLLAMHGQSDCVPDEYKLMDRLAVYELRDVIHGSL